MVVKILGAESLGVRGLCCSIELSSGKIVIDPGIALGWSRHGLLPHPFQIAIGAGIRKRIIEELKEAGDVVFSHFDGDHCPLSDPNPYQLGLYEVQESLSGCRIWSKGPCDSPPAQQKRRQDISKAINRELRNAEGVKAGPLEFSLPVPHGPGCREEHMVMMTRIEERGVAFVHASDIQFLEEATIEKILDWEPDIVLASGPPLYHYSSSSFQKQRERAWKNALKLTQNVKTLIVDHHLLRSQEGIEWLEDLKRRSNHNILCGAEFMGMQPLFLEAWREELYGWLPVPEGWHANYKKSRVSADSYRLKGWEALIKNKKITPCKWYYCCPIKGYTEKGKLDRYWIENYCLVNNHNCVRYQMEERGEYHPDNMLPNGEIKKDL